MGSPLEHQEAPPAVGESIPGYPEIVSLAGYDPVIHNLMGWDILSQDEWWQPADTDRIRLVDMQASHRRNLLAWLVRNAARIEFMDSMLYLHGPFTAGGQMAQDAEAEWLDEKGRDPVGWMQGTKLYLALAALVEQDKAQLNPMAAGWWE